MKTQVAPQATGASAYVDEYWDNLTDAELLSIPWYIDDPRTLPNIQDTIPDCPPSAPMRQIEGSV